MAAGQAVFMLALMVSTAGTAMVHVDMTHVFDNTTTVYWPTARAFRFVITDAGSNDSDDPALYYASKKFCAAEHGGTHMDAPNHFAKGTHGAHEIPLDRLIGTPHVIDASAESARNSDFIITGTWLTDYTKKHGDIPDNVILLLYTGFGSRWPNLTMYLGTDTTNASFLHFPGMDKSGADWLLANTKIKSVGIDTASVDHGQSTTFDAHRILMARNIPFFENVKDIDKIMNKKGVMFYGLPMKIKDGTGAPARIVASYEDDQGSGAAHIKSPALFLLTVAVLLVHLLCCS